MGRQILTIAGQVAGYSLGGPIGAAIGGALGGFAGSALFPTVLPDAHGPRLDDARLTVSTYGVAIPRVWGMVSVAGNIIDASTVREKKHTQTSGGGKGDTPQQTVTTYTYEADIAVAICDGSIDGIVQIYANEELIYDATPGATIVSPDWLAFTLYKGAETQEPDPALEAEHGAGNVPAYRGVSYVVFKSYQFPSQSIAANFRFVVSKSASNAVTETDIDMPADMVNIGYSPRAQVVLYPLAYASARTAGVAAPVLVGIDPFSRDIVWTTSITDGDQFYRYMQAQPCVHPQYAATAVSLGIDEYRNTAIAVLCNGYPTNGIHIHFFDAVTGASIQRSEIHDSASDPVIAFLDPLWLDAIEVSSNAISVVSVSLLSYDAVDGDYSSSELTAPSGYTWELAGAASSNNAGKVVVYASNDTTGDFAVVIIDTDAGVFSTMTTVDMPADFSTVKGAAWDASSQVWWLIGNTTGKANDYTRIYSLTTTGTLTEYDFNALYSDLSDVSNADGTPILWLDDLEGCLWWQDATGTAHQWYVGSQEHNTFAGGSNVGAGIYHRATRTFWGQESGTAYGLHTVGLTGSAAALSDIVDDLCEGTELVPADYDTSDLAAVAVQGFVIGRDMARRDAIQALRNTYLFDFVPRDGVLTGILRGATPTATLTEDDLGAHISGSDGPLPIRITTTGEAKLPVQVDLTYLSASQNYEPVTQTARRLASAGGTKSAVSIPVVLTEEEGAQLCDTLLHMPHISSERYDGAAIPSRLDDCAPGEVITATIDGESYTWRIEDASIIDGGIVELRGARDDASIYESFAVGGDLRTRSRTVQAIGATLLFPLDIPLMRSVDGDAGIYAALGSYTPGWPGCQIYQALDGNNYSELQAHATHAAIGVTLNNTEAWTSRMWDTASVLQVRPINSVFSSSTWEAISTNRNLAAWGQPGRWEIVGFTTASLQADGSYNISGLARGLRDTARYADDHAGGDMFIVLDENQIARIAWSADQYGVVRQLKAAAFGTLLADAVPQSVTPAGVAIKPFSPVRLHGVKEGGGSWTLSWMRQDRQLHRAFAQAANSESGESYSVRILDSLGTVLNTYTATSASFSYSTAQQTADYGAPVDIVYFQVAQVSAVVGAGYWSRACTVGKIYPLIDTTPSNVASYVTSGIYGAGFEAAKAFDDNTGTYWQSSSNLSANPWVGARLTTPKQVHNVTIKQYQFTASNIGYASQAAIEYSDNGSTWTTLEIVTLAQNTTVQSFDVTLTTAREYWRVRATAAAVGGYRWGVTEIELNVPNS